MPTLRESTGSIACMEHEIFEHDGLDGFETTPERRFGQFRTPKVRMIAIPSTLSGGEYNSGALVTDTRRKLKQLFNHPMMMPRSIILDPAMTRYTPEKLWLGSGTRVSTLPALTVTMRIVVSARAATNAQSSVLDACIPLSVEVR